MESRNVFISCTTKDLDEYRQEAVKVMQGLNEEYKGKFQLIEKTMDNQGQSGQRESSVDVSTGWVHKAHWMVLIVAWNYGHVQEGHERSVTEWEYRCSKEKCDPPKPCFVFLAGEKNDGNKRYARKQPDLEQDLRDWESPPNEASEEAKWQANRERLQKFKEDLRQGHVELFSDIEDFSKVLRNTLSTKIKSELQPDGMEHLALLTLILAQKQPAQDFTAEIKQLATLKRIHDRLHRIRQFGVCRWRDEVLNLWQQGAIDGEGKEVFLEVLGEVRQQCGALDALKIGLPRDPSSRLGEFIQHVLACELPSRLTIVTMAREEFERHVNGFARLVQRAFSAADAAMRGRKDALRKQFTALLKALSDARKSQALSPLQDHLLDEGLEQADTRLEAMDVVLERHCRWQNVHNLLEALDLGAQADFRAELADFIRSNRDEICTLLDEAGTVLGCGETVSGCRECLTSKTSAIKALVDVEADGLGDRAETAYASMRTAYDYLFFKLDEKTLAFINQSDERAKTYEARLEELEEQVRRRAVPMR